MIEKYLSFVKKKNKNLSVTIFMGGFFMRKNILYVLIVLFIIGAILLFPKEKKLELVTSDTRMIDVEISGAVAKPGTYQVEKGVTLAYVINLAGGILPSADINSLNLSLLVENKTYEVKTYSKEIKDKTYKVNLNAVTYLELITIPNITEKRALNILLYREQNKKFTVVSDLLNVSGIGDATYEKIKQYFYI